jgi:hypothetical protein
MINSLKMSFKIDITYAINSFIYNIKKFPILKDLFPGDGLYKSAKAKSVIRVLALIVSTIKNLFFKFLYFWIIYMIATVLTPKNITTGILHVYFIFTIIGIFFNNRVLTTSTKKYFSIVLFNMNAKEYMKATLWTELLINLITHSIGLWFLIQSPIIVLYLVFGFLGRVIGERLNVLHYNKYKIALTYNYPLYWTIIILSIIACLLPRIQITITTPIIAILDLIFIPLAIISYIGLMKIDNYKLIYKRLNTKVAAMNSEQARAYSRQAMVDIKEKDKKIDERKLKGKKGYDLFNTIFFERHKEILLRSAKWFATISLLVIVTTAIVIHFSPVLQKNLNDFLLNNIAWFIIVMYFINRGAIITQAMFYNCDHSMLTFNFYRNPKVILNIFKTRVLTVSKVNLIPASVIAIGLPLLLYLSGGTANIINYIAIPIFIIALSIFFSIHYLVIYYLFQPYDKNMSMKSISYSLISAGTYLVAYYLTDFSISTLSFTILAIVAIIIYIILALFLVYKKAPQTFKIR